MADRSIAAWANSDEVLTGAASRWEAEERCRGPVNLKVIDSIEVSKSAFDALKEEDEKRKKLELGFQEYRKTQIDLAASGMFLHQSSGEIRRIDQLRGGGAAWMERISAMKNRKPEKVLSEELTESPWWSKVVLV